MLTRPDRGCDQEGEDLADTFRCGKTKGRADQIGEIYKRAAKRDKNGEGPVIKKDR